MSELKHLLSPSSFPLHAAIRSGNLLQLRKLLYPEEKKDHHPIKQDIDAVNEHGQTALHLAVHLHNNRAIRLLIGAGADWTKLDPQERTALELVKQFLRVAPFSEAYRDTLHALQQAIADRYCGKLDAFTTRSHSVDEKTCGAAAQELLALVDEFRGIARVCRFSTRWHPDSQTYLQQSIKSLEVCKRRLRDFLKRTSALSKKNQKSIHVALKAADQLMVTFFELYLSISVDIEGYTISKTMLDSITPMGSGFSITIPGFVFSKPEEKEFIFALKQAFPAQSGCYFVGDTLNILLESSSTSKIEDVQRQLFSIIKQQIDVLSVRRVGDGSATIVKFGKNVTGEQVDLVYKELKSSNKLDDVTFVIHPHVSDQIKKTLTASGISFQEDPRSLTALSISKNPFPVRQNITRFLANRRNLENKEGIADFLACSQAAPHFFTAPVQRLDEKKVAITVEQVAQHTCSPTILDKTMTAETTEKEAKISSPLGFGQEEKKSLDGQIDSIVKKEETGEKKLSAFEEKFFRSTAVSKQILQGVWTPEQALNKIRTLINKHGKHIAKAPFDIIVFTEQQLRFWLNNPMLSSFTICNLKPWHIDYAEATNPSGGCQERHMEPIMALSKAYTEGFFLGTLTDVQLRPKDWVFTEAHLAAIKKGCNYDDVAGQTELQVQARLLFDPILLRSEVENKPITQAHLTLLRQVLSFSSEVQATHISQILAFSEVAAAAVLGKLFTHDTMAELSALQAQGLMSGLARQEVMDCKHLSDLHLQAFMLGVPWSYIQGITAAKVQENFLSLTQAQIWGLQLGLSVEQIKNDWFSELHANAIEQGSAYEQIAGLSKDQLYGLQQLSALHPLGITEEAIRENPTFKFSEAHLHALQENISWRQIGEKNEAQVQAVLNGQFLLAQSPWLTVDHQGTRQVISAAIKDKKGEEGEKCKGGDGDELPKEAEIGLLLSRFSIEELRGEELVSIKYPNELLYAYASGLSDAKITALTKDQQVLYRRGLTYEQVTDSSLTCFHLQLLTAALKPVKTPRFQHAILKKPFELQIIYRKVSQLSEIQAQALAEYPTEIERLDCKSAHQRIDLMENVGSWLIKEHLDALKAKRTYEEIWELTWPQAAALAVDPRLSREQVAQPWFKQAHYEAIKRGFEYAQICVLPESRVNLIVHHNFSRGAMLHLLDYQVKGIVEYHLNADQVAGYRFTEGHLFLLENGYSYEELVDLQSYQIQALRYITAHPETELTVADIRQAPPFSAAHKKAVLSGQFSYAQIKELSEKQVKGLMTRAKKSKSKALPLTPLTPFQMESLRLYKLRVPQVDFPGFSPLHLEAIARGISADLLIERSGENVLTNMLGGFVIHTTIAEEEKGSSEAKLSRTPERHALSPLRDLPQPIDAKRVEQYIQECESKGIKVKNFSGISLQPGTNLSHLDLDGCCFDGIIAPLLVLGNVKNCTLIGADMPGLIVGVPPAPVASVSKNGENKREAKDSISPIYRWENVAVIHANMPNSSWENVNLRGVQMIQSDLSNSTFKNVGGEKVDFSKTDLTGASFIHCQNLSHISLKKAKLSFVKMAESGFNLKSFRCVDGTFLGQFIGLMSESRESASFELLISNLTGDPTQLLLKIPDFYPYLAWPLFSQPLPVWKIMAEDLASGYQVLKKDLLITDLQKRFEQHIVRGNEKWAHRYSPDQPQVLCSLVEVAAAYADGKIQINIHFLQEHFSRVVGQPFHPRDSWYSLDFTVRVDHLFPVGTDVFHQNMQRLGWPVVTEKLPTEEKSVMPVSKIPEIIDPPTMRKEEAEQKEQKENEKSFALGSLEKSTADSLPGIETSTPSLPLSLDSAPKAGGSSQDFKDTPPPASSFVAGSHIGATFFPLPPQLSSRSPSPSSVSVSRSSSNVSSHTVSRYGVEVVVEPTPNYRRAAYMVGGIVLVGLLTTIAVEAILSVKDTAITSVFDNVSMEVQSAIAAIALLLAIIAAVGFFKKLTTGSFLGRSEEAARFLVPT